MHGIRSVLILLVFLAFIQLSCQSRTRARARSSTPTDTEIRPFQFNPNSEISKQAIDMMNPSNMRKYAATIQKPSKWAGAREKVFNMNSRDALRNSNNFRGLKKRDVQPEPIAEEPAAEESAAQEKPVYLRKMGPLKYPSERSNRPDMSETKEEEPSRESLKKSGLKKSKSEDRLSKYKDRIQEAGEAAGAKGLEKAYDEVAKKIDAKHGGKIANAKVAMGMQGEKALQRVVVSAMRQMKPGPARAAVGRSLPVAGVALGGVALVGSKVAYDRMKDAAFERGGEAFGGVLVSDRVMDNANRAVNAAIEKGQSEVGDDTEKHLVRNGGD